MLPVSCPHCAQSLSLRDEFAGTVRCPACQKDFRVQPRVVPSTGTPSAPSAPPNERTVPDAMPTASPLPLADETRASFFVGTPVRDEMLDFLAPALAADELGRLGEYRILEVLGKGGMGVVLLAEDARLHRKVAIKAMLPQLAHSSSGRQRFLREAEAAASLEHDHIVPILHVGEDRGAPFIVMPFLRGESLDARMKHPVPIALVLRVGIESADALGVAHERGMIHRDIKPANIWLEERKSAESRVKLLDFGLARLTQTSDAEQLTQTGAILGTPGYMPPEQVDGEALDGRADLFSLGCVLYALATGRPAFGGASTTARLLAVSVERPTPPAQVNPEVPVALSDLIMQLLSRERKDRPATAQAVGRRLAAIERTLLANAATEVLSPERPVGSPRPATIEGVPRRGPWRWPIVVGVGLLAALVAFLGRNTVFINITVKDGNEAEVEEPTGGKVVAEVPPVEKGVWTWKPIPLGKSPFDQLDAQEIPAAERFDWQPKNLVAVIGSHARRHWGECRAVAFSPDGQQVATGESEVIVWDMATQKPKWVIPATGWGPVIRPETVSIRYSPDGKRLVIGRQANGRQVQVWDLTGEKPTQSNFGTAEKPGTPIAGSMGEWFEAGRTLLVQSQGKPGQTLTALFDITGEKPRQVVKDWPVFHWPVFAPVANQMIYASPEGKLRRATIKEARFDQDEELPLELGAKQYPRAVTPDGKLLAIWDTDHLELWDLSQKPPRRVQKLEGQDSVTADSKVVFSPDGRWLSTNYTSTALWRIDGEAPRVVGWLDQTNTASAVAFTGDGRRVVVGTSTGFVRFWDLEDAKPRELSPFDPDTAFSNRFSSGNPIDSSRGRMMLGRYDPPARHHRFQLWNLTRFHPRPYPDDKTFLDLGEGFIHGVEGDRWVYISPRTDNRSRRYALRDGRWQQDGEVFGEPRVLGEGSRDGRLLVLVARPEDKDWSLEGYDMTAAPTKKWTVPLKERQVHDEGQRMWFAADARRFLVQTRTGKVGPAEMTVWQNTGPKPEITATIPTREFNDYRAALSRDGRYLAHTKDSHAEGFAVEDLSAEKPREIAAVSSGRIRGNVFALAFSPDGRYLACATHDGVVLFDTTTWKPYWEWKLAPGPVSWIEFADDGRHLFTHNANSTVYVLRLTVLAKE